jgi:hypothetical protein
MKKLLGPLSKLSIFFLILASFLMIGEQIDDLQIFHRHKWFLLIFFYAQTVLTTAFIHFGIKRNQDNMAVFYFGAMIFRFFISLMVAFVLIYKGMDEKVLFVANFFVFYLLFIMFEIYSILTNLRPNFK